MPKNELDGLPVIDVAESEKINVAVSQDDLQAGDLKDPEQHPIAIALRRMRGVDDARVTNSETRAKTTTLFSMTDAKSLAASCGIRKRQKIGHGSGQSPR
jgi:hypothetical protein